MSFKKSRKVHLRSFKLKDHKIIYNKIGSACGSSDLDTSNIKEFKKYLIEFPNDVCKRCKNKYNDLIKEIKQRKNN